MGGSPGGLHKAAILTYFQQCRRVKITQFGYGSLSARKTKDSVSPCYIDNAHRRSFAAFREMDAAGPVTPTFTECVKQDLLN